MKLYSSIRVRTKTAASRFTQKLKAPLLSFQKSNGRYALIGVGFAAILALPLGAVSSLNNTEQPGVATEEVESSQAVELSEQSEIEPVQTGAENTGSTESQTAVGGNSHSNVRTKITVRSSTTAGGETETTEQTVTQESNNSSTSWNSNSDQGMECDYDDDGEGDVDIDCESDSRVRIDCKNGDCD